jgi:predicted XRE-type DNA-binding protein
MTDKQRFSSVWDAIEDTPQNAASMRARSGLMMSLTEVIRQQGMTQAQAAVFFGVTQPRISDLMRGKVNLFSLDTLIDMAATAGMGPTVKVSMPRAAPAKRPARRVAAHALTVFAPARQGRNSAEKPVPPAGLLGLLLRELYPGGLRFECHRAHKQ